MADHEARRLRREITARERGRGKRYPSALREQATRWLRTRVATGTPPRAAATTIGISHETARRWLRADATVTAVLARAELVPVEITDDEMVASERPRRFTIITASELRVEDLILDEVATLLARLR